jgi:rod shape-determining protein MreC
LTVVVLIVLSLTIISVDLNSRTHNVTSGIKSVANDVYSPFRHAVVDVLSPIGDFFAGAVHYGSVQSENQQLRQTIGRLRQDQAERGFNAAELRNLLALKDLPYLNSLPTVTAESVDVDSSNFELTVTIDKGRADGVDVGMPVVGAGGLVGQIVLSFHHTSVVRLITDGQSKVGVTFGPGLTATGTIDGQGPDAPMTADPVMPHTPLHKGLKMFTSSLDDAAFPAGIPVARVTSFHTSAGASQESISVTPLADLSQLSFLDVVQWEPAA